jgi:hypothetical protein
MCQGIHTKSTSHLKFPLGMKVFLDQILISPETYLLDQPPASNSSAIAREKRIYEKMVRSFGAYVPDLYIALN